MANREIPEATRTARTIAEACIGVRVRMLNRAVTRVYDEVLRPHGIRFSQMNILTTIGMQATPIQPAEIARILSIEKSTLSRNLRIMETNGWIRTLPADAGNSQRLGLTAKGRQLLQRAAPAWRRAQKRVTEALGRGTTEAIARAVDRVGILQNPS